MSEHTHTAQEAAQRANAESPNPVKPPDFDALTTILTEILAVFKKAPPESRKTLLTTVATFFGIDLGVQAATHPDSKTGGRNAFSEDRSISPKEFLRQKQPRTDVERVVCLAYYLTHYRDTPHFKTLDISQLNTEAAQIKFANPAVAVNNSAMYGYLSATTKGNKQITAMGESFAEALPDREAARQVISTFRKRRRRKRDKNEEPENVAPPQQSRVS
ncbi:MAG TPA: hypothetical protein VMR80_10495 [Candidatus Acidoferrum sp.]|nr:hypothetical protein [Candidatus Acidoferrum sp.]